MVSELTNKKLKEIDEACLPCFLGTQDKENVAIYEKFTFQELGKTLFSLILPITPCFDLETDERPFSRDKDGALRGWRTPHRGSDRKNSGMTFISANRGNGAAER